MFTLSSRISSRIEPDNAEKTGIPPPLSGSRIVASGKFPGGLSSNRHDDIGMVAYKDQQG
jgi:hypothetical protein